MSLPYLNKEKGGVAEWSKAAVLKTVERKLRGFESYLLRQKTTDGFPYESLCGIIKKIGEFIIFDKQLI